MQTSRAHRRRVIGALLAFLGTAQLLAGVLAPAPVAAESVPTGTILGFEADGDQDVDFTGDAGATPPVPSNIDWESLDPTIATDLAPTDNGFQGSSKENDPTLWECNADGGDDPGKDDLLRAYIHPDITLDKGLLALGFVRRTTEGNTHVNFEFNQGPITFELGEEQGGGPVDCVYLGRKTGDILITFEFPGNGTADLFIYRWQADAVVPNEGVWVELVLDDVATVAAGSDNAAPIVDEVVGGDLIARAFGEVALDLKALEEEFGQGTFLRCPGFGVASVRSRSAGTTFSSALQDFINPIPIDLSTCGSIKIKKVDDLGNPMQGVTFTLHSSLEPGTVVDTCVSAANGTCTFDDVPPTAQGETYFVNEDPATVPAGYTPATNPVKSGITVGFKQDVDLTTAPIVNARQTGHVEITKQLAELGPNGGADVIVVPDDLSDLAGTSFLLYEDDAADGGNGNGEYDTGEEIHLRQAGPPVLAQCTIASGDDSCVIGPVATGGYRITETAWPEDTTPGEDVAVTITEDHTAQDPQDATFTNYLTPLQITLIKSGPATANLGDTFTYTFNVTTSGPALTDILLEELSPDRCNVAAKPLSGPTKSTEPGDQDDWLEVGETWSYSCDHLVTVADPDPLPNEAKVTGTDAFGRDVSDTDTHNVDLLYPDVVVQKVAVDDTLTAGDGIAFDITVDNTGDGIARSVTLTDDLPAGIVWSDNSSQCEIDTVPDPDELSCSFGDLAPADPTITVRISGTTSTAVCGTVSNTAVVGATNERTADTQNNSSTDTVEVSCPDVEITKVGNGTINAGDDAVFTITVKNNDLTGTATDVTVSDTLPAGIDWQENHDDCSIAAGVLSCDFGDLGPGATEVVTVSGETAPADCGLVPNTAKVASSNEGPDLDENNEDSDTVTVECPDITIDKTPDAGVVNAGDDVSFTIVVGNDGPGVAYDVTVTDDLPDEVSWAIVPAVPGCAIDGDGDLECDLGDLAEGDEVTITLTGTSEPADCGVLDNTAFVDASNDDQVSDDGQITVQCPDIDIDKDADDTSVSAGSDIGFTLTVTNDGPGTAYDVTVEDELPGDLAWELDPAVTGCAITAGVLECDLGDLEDGDEVEIHVTAATDEDDCGSYDNLATVDASNDDPEDDSATTAVLCPGLNVLKSAHDLLVDAGDEVGFEITVTNVDDGDDPPEGTATDVTLVDELPEGFEWSLDPAVEGCAIAAGVLECELGDLEPGDSVTIHVVATSGIDDCGTLNNVAVADSGNGPSDDDDAQIDVLCPLDIEVDKTGPAVAHVGDEITYDFTVTNTGEADLVSVTLSDPRCDEGSLVVVDDADGDPVLAVDEVWTYQCTHVVADTDPDPLPNTATVIGEDERERTTDDTDDHEVDIIHPAIQIVKTVDDSGPNPGDTVTFSYEVTNTGDTTLFDVLVEDDQLGDVGTIEELSPGEVVVLTKDDVVQADQSLVNVGTATGTDVLGEVVTDDDDEVIAIVIPSVVTNPPAPEVLRSVLARTGIAFGAFLLLAGIALLSGVSLTEIGRRLRRIDR